MRAFPLRRLEKTNENLARISVLLILFGTSICRAQQESLYNQRVIALLNAGLSESVIVLKIKDGRSSFDLSTAALVDLKKLRGVRRGYQNNVSAKKCGDRLSATKARRRPGCRRWKSGIGIHKNGARKKQAHANARTVAINKSPIQASR